MFQLLCEGVGYRVNGAGSVLCASRSVFVLFTGTTMSLRSKQHRKHYVAKLKCPVSGPNTMFFSVSKWAWPNGESAVNQKEHSADLTLTDIRPRLALPNLARGDSVKIQDVSKSKHIIEECGVYKELISRSGFQDFKVVDTFWWLKKKKHWADLRKYYIQATLISLPSTNNFLCYLKY